MFLIASKSLSTLTCKSRVLSLVLPLPLTSSVTLDMSVSFSEAQFP